MGRSRCRDLALWGSEEERTASGWRACLPKGSGAEAPDVVAGVFHISFGTDLVTWLA